MMRRTWRRPSGLGSSAACKPPWWPENEAWPPRGQTRHWRAGRGRFFRRVAALAFVVLMLSVCGMVALAWLAATKLGLVAASGSATPIILFFGGFAGVGLALFALVAMMLRVAVTMGGGFGTAGRASAAGGQVSGIGGGTPPDRAA